MDQKLKVLIIGSVTLVQACVNNSVKHVNTPMNGSVKTVKQTSTLLDLKGKFKYKNLQNFNVDGLKFNDCNKQLVPLDSNASKLIFSKPGRESLSLGYNKDYFYSWQERNNNLIEFTLITLDEENSCVLLNYYVFDKNGKFINEFNIASSCGDGGWSFKAQGKQVNNSTFKVTMIESESDLSDDSEEGDSTIHKIMINLKGQISTKEIYKKHFVSPPNIIK